MIKPSKLKAGDTVATVSLSWGGPGTFPHRYQAGKEQLEQTFGVKVVEMQHTLKSAEWLYKNPRARAEDFMAAILDPSIKAIISTIGGDDSVRILPFLDLDVIHSNPKIFLGYSDTTATHFALYKAGLISFYGPSIMAGFGENGGIMPYMGHSVRKTLFENEKIGVVPRNADGWTTHHLDWSVPDNQYIKRTLQLPTGPVLLQGAGRATGHLLGGCIEVLEMLKATPYWPTAEQWEGAILFIETSEDMPPLNHFKYWIRNYGAQGILHSINGILFGRPGGNIPFEQIGKYDEALLQVIRDEFGLFDLPILSQMDFGHSDPIFIIPYGLQAEINCDDHSFSILENAVV